MVEELVCMVDANLRQRSLSHYPSTHCAYFNPSHYPKTPSCPGGENTFGKLCLSRELLSDLPRRKRDASAVRDSFFAANGGLAAPKHRLVAEAAGPRASINTAA